MQLQALAGYSNNKLSADDDANSQQYQTPVKRAFRQGTARVLETTYAAHNQRKAGEISPAMLNMNQEMNSRSATNKRDVGMMD